MQIINIYEAKTHLSKLIAQVQKGKEIVIGKNGTPVAKLSAVSPKKLQPRKPGAWKGKIKFSKDYDKADKEIEDMFNNSEIFPNNA